MGICWAHQITDQWQYPQWCQSYLSTSYYLAFLPSLIPQTISLVLRLVIPSTDQCTFLLKQTPSYFVIHGSSVHAVFSDASKAFDRVLHMKLFEKLIHQ